MSKPDIKIEAYEERKRLSVSEGLGKVTIGMLGQKKRHDSGSSSAMLEATTNTLWIQSCDDNNNNEETSTNFLHPGYTERSNNTARSGKSYKLTCDWSENAIRGEHVWFKIGSSNEACYVSEMDSCSRKNETKVRCSACKICVHLSCITEIEKINFKCKPTFRESMCAKQAETSFRHHWVHRRRQEGRCKQCGKTFQQKFPFNNKDVIAISCSWCKTAYHNKLNCFMMQQINENCSMGIHASLILPPPWILKVPKRKASTTAGIKRASIHRSNSKRKRSYRSAVGPFVIKAPSNSHIHPIIVLVNPKSGGQQGSKLIHEFNWLLNPRQVFDISTTGPLIPLELFKKMSVSFRILVCGGDGTVGWVLSALDQIEMTHIPPCAILPLGTGNDLARTLNWGSGYTDEPLSKILQAVEDSKLLKLDRWNVCVEPIPETGGENSSPPPFLNSTDEQEFDTGAVSDLPISIFNNYFSIGADAAAAMEFHESREARPEKFNNRFKNKMFYAGVGGKDLLKRSWKDLSDFVSLTCDGIDLTQRIKDLRLHCLLFLNIPRYSAGTNPWGNPTVNVEYAPQSISDGLLEVIGFTSTSLATLQVGGHGERITQCHNVTLTTQKTIPVQLDGEPCRLRPSIITLQYRNSASMLLKMKRRASLTTLLNEDNLLSYSSTDILLERLRLQVNVISFTDYEDLLFDKERLKHASIPLGIIVVDNDADLTTVRSHISRIAKENELMTTFGTKSLSDDWIFLDSTTSERFYRLDRSQEKLHFVTDVSSEDIYILDNQLHNAPSLPEMVIEHLTKVAAAAASSNADGEFLTPEQGREIVEENRKRASLIIETLGPRRCSCNSGLQAEESTKNLIPPSMEKRLQQRRNSYMDMLNKAFFDACKRGNAEKVKQLLEDGADINYIDPAGMTCLHHAARFGYIDAVCVLVEWSSQLIHMKDVEKGQTPLHKAVWYKRVPVCKYLVEKGASILCVDNNEDDAISLARKNEDLELEKYFKEIQLERNKKIVEMD